MDKEAAYQDFTVNIIAESGIAPNQEFQPFTLRLTNPCHADNGLPKSSQPSYCLDDDVKDFYSPKIPQWMAEIKDQVIFIGEKKRFDLGEAVNQYQEEIEVIVDLGVKKTAYFVYYTKETNSMEINGSKLTFADLGYWKIIVSATETKFDETYVYEKVFYIRVMEMPEDDSPVPVGPEGIPLSGQIVKESLIRESNESKPVPFVEGLDSTGLLTIGWSNRLVPPSDYAEIAETTILVQGVPQDSPSDQRRQLQSEGGDVRLRPIRESSEEF